MKKIILIGLAMATIGCLNSSLGAQTSPYDKYLTVADLEAAGKLTGVKIVPYNPS
jgi:hypothetical protein